jgi:hypothetical protein
MFADKAVNKEVKLNAEILVLLTLLQVRERNFDNYIDKVKLYVDCD